MKFTISGRHLVISIAGHLFSYPNTAEGYRKMAARWWMWRSA